MKKRLLSAITPRIAKCSMLFISLIGLNTAMAQHNTNTPQFGLYTTAAAFENKVPFANTDTLFERTQVIYKASEIIALSGTAKAPSGDITKVYMRTKLTAPVDKYTLKNVMIKLTQTTDTVFKGVTPTSPDVPFMTCTEVFKEASYEISTPGWIEFTLKTKFKYDNTKNLVFEISGDNGPNSAIIGAANQNVCTGKLNNSLGGYGFTKFEFGMDISGATSVSNLDAATYVNVYPNPANDKVTVSASEDLTGNIVITDINGRIMLQEQIQGKQHTLSVASLANGLYFYKVLNSDNTQLTTGKLSVSH